MTTKADTRAPARWSPDQFKGGGAGDDPIAGEIDITGRMRPLVVGPMTPLAAGRWRLTVRFALDRRAAAHPYILQFIHGENLVERHFQPAGPGEYALNLDNEYPHDALMALRLWLAEPAFDGKLYFLGAEAQPLAG
jgi:hypothetical protein